MRSSCITKRVQQICFNQPFSALIQRFQWFGEVSKLAWFFNAEPILKVLRRPLTERVMFSFFYAPTALFSRLCFSSRRCFPAECPTRAAPVPGGVWVLGLAQGFFLLSCLLTLLSVPGLLPTCSSGYVVSIHLPPTFSL